MCEPWQTPYNIYILDENQQPRRYSHVRPSVPFLCRLDIRDYKSKRHQTWHVRSSISCIDQICFRFWPRPFRPRILKNKISKSNYKRTFNRKKLISGTSIGSALVKIQYFGLPTHAMRQIAFQE